jgi:hypothetical protein
VFHRNGAFSLIKEALKERKPPVKGELYVVRFVKAVSGKGLAVQVSPSISSYGFI